MTYAQAMAATSRQISVKATMTLADTTVFNLTDAHIMLFTVNEGNSSIPLGTCVSGVYTLDLANSVGEWLYGGSILGNKVLMGAKVALEIGVYHDAAWDWAHAGVFYVDRTSAIENDTRMKLYGNDPLVEILDIAYTDTLGYRSTTDLQDVLDHIRSKGVTINGTLACNAAAIISREPDWGDNCTLRTALGYVAQMGGCFVRCDREGVPELVPTQAASVARTITTSIYLNLTDDENFFNFNRIKALPVGAKKENYVDAHIADVAESAANTIAISNNPLLRTITTTSYSLTNDTSIKNKTYYTRVGNKYTESPEPNEDYLGIYYTRHYAYNTTAIQGMVDALATALTGLVYRSIGFKWRGDPTLFAGDRIALTDTRAVSTTFSVVQCKMTFDQGFSAEISCPLDLSSVTSIQSNGASAAPRFGIGSFDGMAIMPGTASGGIIVPGGIVSDSISADIDLTIYAGHNLTIASGADIEIESGGDLNIAAGGHLNLTAPDGIYIGTSPMQVGGTNLIPNSNWVQGLDGWGHFGSTPLFYGVVEGGVSYDGVAVEGVNPYSEVSRTITNIHSNAPYVLSFLCGNPSFPVHIYLIEKKEDGSDTAVSSYHIVNLEIGLSRKVTITITTQPDCARVILIFRAMDGDVGYFSQAKLELGNIATDWSPAPEDAIAGIAGANQAAADAHNLADSAQGAANTAHDLADAAQSTANGRTKTFFQDGIPTATAIGDLWVDTDNGNRMYRAAAVGASDWTLCPIKAGSLASSYISVDDTKIDVVSGGNINMETGTNLNVKSGADIEVSSGGDVNIASGGHLNLSAPGGIYIGTAPMQVGGTNLVLDSWYNITTADYAFGHRTGPLLPNTQYTISVRGNRVGADAMLLVGLSDQLVSLVNVEILSATETTVSYIFTTGAASASYDIYCYSYPNNNGGTIYLKWIKLELGNIATDWSPAPSDPASGVKTSHITVATDSIDVASTGSLNLTAADINMDTDSTINIHEMTLMPHSADNENGAIRMSVGHSLYLEGDYLYLSTRDAVSETWDPQLLIALTQSAFYNDLYCTLNCSALTFTDRTPAYAGDALTDLSTVKNKDGKIDHASLPAVAHTKIKHNEKVDGKYIGVEEDGRDLGMMISILTKAVQQLTTIVTDQNKRLDKLEAK